MSVYHSSQDAISIPWINVPRASFVDPSFLNFPDPAEADPTPGGYLWLGESSTPGLTIGVLDNTDIELTYPAAATEFAAGIETAPGLHWPIPDIPDGTDLGSWTRYAVQMQVDIVSQEITSGHAAALILGTAALNLYGGIHAVSDGANVDIARISHLLFGSVGLNQEPHGRLMLLETGSADGSTTSYLLTIRYRGPSGGTYGRGLNTMTQPYNDIRLYIAAISPGTAGVLVLRNPQYRILDLFGE